MPRAAHCIDNGPMEGFRSILKRECYYGKRFTSKQALIQTCEKLLYYVILLLTGSGSTILRSVLYNR